MMEAAMDHDGFSFVECLSECVEFYEGAFDCVATRAKAAYSTPCPPITMSLTKWPPYNWRASRSPVSFGIFYKATKATKNAKEAEINKAAMEKTKGLKDWQILQKSFDRMK
jgi:2-oxoglutarate ferredoxin oxidoreductase subunit beta